VVERVEDKLNVVDSGLGNGDLPGKPTAAGHARVGHKAIPVFLKADIKGPADEIADLDTDP
jgi:hypothetical protein